MRLSDAQFSALKIVAAGKLHFHKRIPYDPDNVRLDVIRKLKLTGLIYLKWTNREKLQGIYKLTRKGEVMLALWKLKERTHHGH